MAKTSTTSKDPFRILSLDGGGVRGYLTARLLLHVEEYLNSQVDEGHEKPIGEYFDLIAGTSTGALIALALSRGATAAEVFAMYEEHIPKIFKKRWLRRGWFGPKYDPAPLKTAITELLGESAELHEAKTPVLVVSVDPQNAKPRLYKGDRSAIHQGRGSEKMVDVALASSAAPTYFPMRMDMEHSHALVDGGLCANNPSLVAIVEALRGKRLLDEVIMLSVGTGEPSEMPYDVLKMEKAGPLKWVHPIIELVLQVQSDLAHRQAGFMLGERYHRFNPPLKMKFALDDTKKVPLLKNIADIEYPTKLFLDRYFLDSGK